MDSVIFMKLFGILLLIAGNAYFVGSEIALTSARRSRIHHLAEHGDPAAKIVKIEAPLLPAPSNLPRTFSRLFPHHISCQLQ